MNDFEKMSDFEKNLAVELVESTIDSAVKGMSSATLQILFTCFADKDFSHFAKAEMFLNFLSDAVKNLPDDAKREIVNFAFIKIGDEGEIRCKDNLKKYGVNVDEVEEIINNAKKDKKVRVKKETKFHRVKNNDELKDLLKEIIGGLEKESEDAD